MVTKYGSHAREQMVARGISEQEVEKAIKRGSKELQGKTKILAHYRYFTVVYKRIGDGLFVITVKPR